MPRIQNIGPPSHRDGHGVSPIRMSRLAPIPTDRILTKTRPVSAAFIAAVQIPQDSRFLVSDVQRPPARFVRVIPTSCGEVPMFVRISQPNNGQRSRLLTSRAVSAAQSRARGPTRCVLRSAESLLHANIHLSCRTYNSPSYHVHSQSHFRWNGECGWLHNTEENAHIEPIAQDAERVWGPGEARVRLPRYHVRRRIHCVLQDQSWNGQTSSVNCP